MSEIDIEVVVLLVGVVYWQIGDLIEVMCYVVVWLYGVFMLLVMYEEVFGVVVGVWCNFLFVIGFGEGENFFGLDVVVFVEYICQVFEIGQDQIVII